MIGLRAPLLPGGWPDLRLAPAASAAWLTAILVLRIPGSAGVLVVAGVGATLAVIAVLLARGRASARPWAWPVAAVAVCVVGVGGVATLRSASVRPATVEALVSERASAEVELVVTSDPVPLRGRFSADRVRVAARLESIRTARSAADVRAPVTVFAPGTWGELLPGTALRVRARFGPTRYREDAALLVVRGPPSIVTGPGRVQRAAGAVRDGLHEAVAGFPADARALVPGMVLGDTSQVSAELKEAEQVAGLTHLTAVSGANVAILLAAVLGTARALGMRRRMLLVIGLCAVVGFVVVARPAPSVLRAAVMGCIALVGVMRGITGRGPQILAAGVLLLLAANPWLAASPGFALSVVATAALLLVAPWWRDQLCRWLPLRVAEPLAVATVAHLATAPLVVALSGHVSLVAVAANLAVEPAVIVVTVCGALAAVVSPVSPDLARWCAVPAGCGAWWVAQVAHRAAALPWAEVGWPAGAGGVVALLVIALVGLARGPALLGAAAALVGPRQAVGPAWHASRDAEPDAPAPGHPRGGTGGPARRAGRRAGRHRRPRGRRRGRRA